MRFASEELEALVCWNFGWLLVGESWIQTLDFRCGGGEADKRIHKFLLLFIDGVEPGEVAEVGVDELAVEAAVFGAEFSLGAKELVQLAGEGCAGLEEGARPLN